MKQTRRNYGNKLVSRKRKYLKTFIIDAAEQLVQPAAPSAAEPAAAAAAQAIPQGDAQLEAQAVVPSVTQPVPI